MFNFFAKEQNLVNNRYIISGSDCNHIKNVLRMEIGEKILISCEGSSDLCAIAEIKVDEIFAEIIEKNYQASELKTEIYLFQGLPKSDKLELIIQKAVELGASKIIPTEMTNCVVRIEEKKRASKKERWQKIAESAAKQSKRAAIPEVFEPLSYRNALKIAEKLDLILVPYENKSGMTATVSALEKIESGSKIGVFIGPEGGFTHGEIEALENIGSKTISLGKRILRTETAAITALSMLMLYCEIKEEKE